MGRRGVEHTSLAAHYRRIASRRGVKRAAMALAHSMLVIIYHLLRDRTSYREVGETYFEERHRQADRCCCYGLIQRHGVEALNDLGLSYTPPLSSSWDLIQMSAQSWMRAAMASGRG